MKKFIAGVSVLALALAVLPAAASTITSVNDESLARILYRLDLALNGTNINEAEISNETVSTANSGGNSITSEEYQSNTSISTGAADAVALVENNANEIETSSGFSLEFGSGNDDIESVNDGSNAKIKNLQYITEGFGNDNIIFVDNAVGAAANSGDNETSSAEALQYSGISAGAASSGTSILNSFNRISETFSRIIK